MTTLEYMEKELNRNYLNYKREAARGVPKEMLNNIEAKIGYYRKTINILKSRVVNIDKFWEIISEEYGHRDMLTFDEIQSIIDKAIINKE